MSDLTSLVMELRAAQAGVLPRAHGEMLQACFLRTLIEPLDAALSRALHDGAGAHAYTVSPLAGDFEAGERGLRVQEGVALRWRATGLTAEVGAALEQVARRPPEAIAVGRLPLTVTHTRLEGDAEARQLDYGELWRRVEENSGATSVRLGFLTPTSFHAQARAVTAAQDVVLPLPHLVFASLWHRWRRFAPAAQVRQFAPPLIDAFGEQITLGDYELHSALDRFRKAERRGFLGWAEFHVAPAAAVETRFLLRLLAEYSFFAGIGRGTTYGSGQTRPL